MKKLKIMALMLAVPALICAKEFSLLQEQNQYPIIDVLMNDFLEQSRLPGISVTVSRKGEVVHSKGYGYADVEGMIKMKPETQIRAASVSKVITVTAIAKLLSEGKLDLDAPIGTYVPQLSVPFTDLTIRQLAGHTAGVQHRAPRKNHKKKHYETVGETLALFKNTSLMFEPDTKYEYSSNAYNLLAAVIEGASGKSYMKYMKEDIFKPLGMTRTNRDLKSALTDNDAKMYFYRKDKLTLDKTFSDGTHKLAGAGFKTTSVDLVKMMEAYSNGFIDSKVVASMFRSHRLKNGEKTNVGVGWRINQDMLGRQTIEHAGSRQGARTVIVYYPEQELSISLMINAKCNVFIEETAHIIAQVFLNNVSQSADLKEVDFNVSIISNDENGEEKESQGNISLRNDGSSKFVMDTESPWIRESHMIPLNDKFFALSTDFGLLYLEVKDKPIWEGELHLYQLLNDKYHPANSPFLRIRQQ